MVSRQKGKGLLGLEGKVQVMTRPHCLSRTNSVNNGLTEDPLVKLNAEKLHSCRI